MIGAGAVRSSPASRGGGPAGPPSDFRGCCASCGARFTADAQFCQQCGCKRYPDPLPATRPSIKSTAGTLQDLGLDSEKARPEKVSTPRGGSFSVSLKTNNSGYSRPKLQPTPAWTQFHRRAKGFLPRYFGFQAAANAFKSRAIDLVGSKSATKPLEIPLSGRAMPQLKQKDTGRSSSSRSKRPRLESKGAEEERVEAAEADDAAEAKAEEAEEVDEDLEDTEDDADDGLRDDGSSDDSEDDAPRNRIGNVPLDWYKDEDHVGYDIAGEKVMRTLSTSEIDALLESKDNPDAWRTIKDHKNQREVVLTDTDLEVIRRIRQRMYPSMGTDTTEMVEFENPEARIHPESKAHPPKSRFLPSKWERMKVKRLVALLREGKIRPPPPPAPEVFDLWADDAKPRRKAPVPLPAPKMALPGHAESYNPPSEYLFTEEEKKEWEETFEQDRTITHLPQKFDCLRHVPGYKDFMVERFKRCLDLYLVPRALKQRMNVDPESLLPKLPSPKDLRPFPTHISVSYEGHSGMVRAVAVEASGRYLATASSDETLRIWEVATGRPIRSIKFSSAVTAVAWNPQQLLLSVAAEENVFFLDPGLELQATSNISTEDATEMPVPIASLLEFKEDSLLMPTMQMDVIRFPAALLWDLRNLPEEELPAVLKDSQGAGDQTATLGLTQLEMDQVLTRPAGSTAALYVLQKLHVVASKLQLAEPQSSVLQQALSKLSEAVEACQKEKRQALPQIYQYSAGFVFLWLALLPFILPTQLQVGVVLAQQVLAFGLLGIEDVTIQLEEPFAVLPMEGPCTSLASESQALRSNWRRMRKGLERPKAKEPPQKYSLGFPRQDRVFPCYPDEREADKDDEVILLK
eukprot:s497_g19.t1